MPAKTQKEIIAELRAQLKATKQKLADVAPQDEDIIKDLQTELAEKDKKLKLQKDINKELAGGNALEAKLKTSWKDVDYSKPCYLLDCVLTQDRAGFFKRPEGKYNVSVPARMHKITRETLSEGYMSELHFINGKSATNDLRAARAFQSKCDTFTISQYIPKTIEEETL